MAGLDNLQHPLAVLRPQLRQLRRNHGQAIPLLGVVAEVALMILFGRAVVGDWRDFGDDRLVPELLAIEFGDHLARGLLLLRRVREDHGAVLRPDVGALAIERRRVVHAKEDLQ